MGTDVSTIITRTCTQWVLLSGFPGGDKDLQSQISLLKGDNEAFKADKQLGRVISCGALCVGILGGVGQLLHLPGDSTWDFGVPCDILGGRYFIVLVTLVTLSLVLIVLIVLIVVLTGKFDRVRRQLLSYAGSCAGSCGATGRTRSCACGATRLPTTPYQYHGVMSCETVGVSESAACSSLSRLSISRVSVSLSLSLSRKSPTLRPQPRPRIALSPARPRDARAVEI